MALASDYSESQFPYLQSGAKPPWFTRLVKIKCNDTKAPATISDTSETLNNVRYPLPCPKPLPAQLLSRHCLGKKEKRILDTNLTYIQYQVSCLSGREERQLQDALRQLARLSQVHCFRGPQLRKDPSFQSGVGMSPLVTCTRSFCQNKNSCPAMSVLVLLEVLQ